MAKVKALLARAPGTNCDGETKFAFEQVGADVEVVHLNELLAQPQKLHAAQVFCAGFRLRGRRPAPPP